MVSKRSQHELKRLVEDAVSNVCGLPRPGLWFCIDEIEATGAPPEKITVWATLHFTAAGSPFHCGEPVCHLGLFGERLDEIGEHLRRAMALRQKVTLEFAEITSNYHQGVWFHYGQLPASAKNLGWD